MTDLSDVAPRFRIGTKHVESWFLRANDPASPRAIWLKATVLTRADGTSVSQSWFSCFDGDRTEAACLDSPLEESRFDSSGERLELQVGQTQWTLTEAGGASNGTLDGTPSTMSWDLSYERFPGPLGEPLTMLPTSLLIDAPFPKNKLLTPQPLATFSGSVSWGGETWDLGGWHGMQGHNWGAAHSPEYAWGQCVFVDDSSGSPVAMLEATSGRLALGPVNSPFISLLVLRRGTEEYRFDHIVDLWRQHPDVQFPRWGLKMTGRDGTAELEMSATPAEMVCLAYENPNHVVTYCLNSKTAQVRVRMKPRRGPAFELQSACGGALEFLLPEPVAEVQPVVG